MLREFMSKLKSLIFVTEPPADTDTPATPKPKEDTINRFLMGINGLSSTHDNTGSYTFSRNVRYSGVVALYDVLMAYLERVYPGTEYRSDTTGPLFEYSDFGIWKPLPGYYRICHEDLPDAISMLFLRWHLTAPPTWLSECRTMQRVKVGVIRDGSLRPWLAVNRSADFLDMSVPEKIYLYPDLDISAAIGVEIKPRSSINTIATGCVVKAKNGREYIMTVPADLEPALIVMAVNLTLDSRYQQLTLISKPEKEQA